MRTKKVNAGKNRIINILPKDNCHAVLKDHQHCVIAKAIKRQTGAEWVDVGASTVLIKRKYKKHIDRYLLKPMAVQQVRFFDTKGMFAPCQIALTAPPKPTGRKNKGGPRGKQRRSLATR